MAKLTKLEGLYLGETQITDKTVRALVKLPNLEKLWLHDLPVTDASVEVLSKMKALRELHVYATKLSPKADSAYNPPYPAAGSSDSPRDKKTS